MAQVTVHPVRAAREAMRQENGEPWRLEDLAKKIGRSKSFVSNVENGYVPKLFRMEQIAAALQTTPQKLWPDDAPEGTHGD